MGRGAVSQAQSLIRRAMWPAVSLLIIGTFAGHAVAGPNGLLAWGGYHRDCRPSRQELAKLEERADARSSIARPCSIPARPIPTWPMN